MKRFYIPPLLVLAAFVMRHAVWLIALACLPFGSAMASGIEMRKAEPAMHSTSIAGCDPCLACYATPAPAASTLADGSKRALASSAWMIGCTKEAGSAASPVSFHRAGTALRILYCCWRN